MYRSDRSLRPAPEQLIPRPTDRWVGGLRVYEIRRRSMPGWRERGEPAAPPPTRANPSPTKSSPVDFSCGLIAHPRYRGLKCTTSAVHKMRRARAAWAPDSMAVSSRTLLETSVVFEPSPSRDAKPFSADHHNVQCNRTLLQNRSLQKHE